MSTRLEHIRGMLKDDPNDPFLWYAGAMELRNAGEHKEALEWYAHIHQHHPDYLPNYYQFGTLLEELGERKQALEIYAAGIALASGRGEGKTRTELAERHGQLAEELEL